MALVSTSCMVGGGIYHPSSFREYPIHDDQLQVTKTAILGKIKVKPRLKEGGVFLHSHIVTLSAVAKC